MTLITTFVREDFALLFADKRAITTGPTTITTGKITINSMNGLSVTGFQKVTLNTDRSAAIGIAGEVAAHPYVKDFAASANVDDALGVVDSFLEDFHDSQDGKPVSELGKIHTRQSALMPFWEAQKKIFFMRRFTFNEFYLEKEVLSALPTHYIMRNVGSGAGPFQALLSTPEVARVLNEFTPGEKSKGLAEVSELIAHIKKLYEAVSCVDKGVSKEVTVLLATKDSPQFQEVKS